MKIDGEIKSAVREVLKDLGVDQFDLVLARNLSHGDFSTNISLTIFTKLIKNSQILSNSPRT